ncbi:hypothetical protein [Nocardia fluminea]|uniref:Uncharacterized protein n=1 Tax=Nocardia fluminea TaxID=134984 RepID=A0A2N3VL71_9NOCA|nr:hypothetical protein [Nocardia fluminea]PKV82356.1 hypothetical protein ATK86_6843 [Nocardia fluminea]
MNAILLCGRDPGPLTAQQAHRAMQVHLECAVDTCRSRRRARATLVEQKRMVLDERAQQVSGS